MAAVPGRAERIENQNSGDINAEGNNSERSKSQKGGGRNGRKRENERFREAFIPTSSCQSGPPDPQSAPSFDS